MKQPKILYLDNNGAEVAKFHRPFKTTCRCFTCFCPCCLQEMEITSGGAIIGYIIQIQARDSIVIYRSKIELKRRKEPLTGLLSTNFQNL